MGKYISCDSNLFVLFKSCAPIFGSRAERKCFTIVAPIRYSNTSSRYRNETRCIDTARSFFQPPHLDYVVRFVAAVKKNSRDDTYIVLRSFDTTLAAACYIVALDIDHAEKLQRVKRNLRC